MRKMIDAVLLVPVFFYVSIVIGALHSNALDQVTREKHRCLKLTRANFERMFFFYFVPLSFSFRQVAP